jgi:hypothetical protein
MGAPLFVLVADVSRRATGFQAPIRGLGHNWAVRQSVQTFGRARSSRTRDDRLSGPPR